MLTRLSPKFHFYTPWKSSTSIHFEKVPLLYTLKKLHFYTPWKSSTSIHPEKVPFLCTLKKFHFYTPWKCQKTGFLTFSEGIEVEHWTKMVRNIFLYSKLRTWSPHQTISSGQLWVPLKVGRLAKQTGFLSYHLQSESPCQTSPWHPGKETRFDNIDSYPINTTN